jgi:hypothetical protein
MSEIETISKIDLDVAAIEAKLTTFDFAGASQLYSSGAHSGGVAILEIIGLSKNLTRSTVVQQGTYALGKLDTDVLAGGRFLRVEYMSMCTTSDSSGCFSPNIANVLVNGEVVELAKIAATVYNSLRKLSVGGLNHMGAFQWQEIFSVYRSYYKDSEYANKMVTAALDGTGMCAACEDISRVEFAQRAMVYMNVWMYVIRAMEDGIAACEHGCRNCLVRPSLSGVDIVPTFFDAWDEAFAYYTGSSEGPNGQGSGKLLYALADSLCSPMGTCVKKDGDKSTSAVNEAILISFTMGQMSILQSKCFDAFRYKRQVVKLMTVPLLQGSLLYAHKVAITGGPCTSLTKCEELTRNKAAAAAFSAAILPRIAACDSDAAELISNNLKIQQDPMAAGFAAVKAAFERTYDCLSVTCKEIGGILGADGKAYADGAAPCDTTSESSSQGELLDNETLIGLIVALVVLVCTCGCIALYLLIRCKKYQHLAEINDAQIASNDGAVVGKPWPNFQ